MLSCLFAVYPLWPVKMNQLSAHLKVSRLRVLEIKIRTNTNFQPQFCLKAALRSWIYETNESAKLKYVYTNDFYNTFCNTVKLYLFRRAAFLFNRAIPDGSFLYFHEIYLTGYDEMTHIFWFASIKSLRKHFKVMKTFREGKLARLHLQLPVYANRI